MAIGAGWAEGAWVDAGWVVGAWEQPSAAKTIGGTSQLGAFSSTGGLQVGRKIGGTSQLGALGSSATIQVVSTQATATGGQRGPITVGKKKRKTLKTPKARQATEQEYYLSKEFVEKIEKGVLEVAGVEMFLQTPVDIPRPPLSENLTELSVIKDEVEREIAQLMREKVVSEYKVKVESYVKDMRQMEMKMYFIALALLDEDF